jgi:hypothetical protein
VDSGIPSNIGKIAVADLIVTGVSEALFMHARPQIKEILIARKMQRWCAIARWPLINTRCPPARARKNYWRLLSKYPEVGKRLGLSVVTVYLP